MPRSSKTIAVPLHSCAACGRPSKDRTCTACRVRKTRGALIAGERCAVCDVDHPAVMRWHKFTDGERALCANHAALAGRRRTSFVAYRRCLPEGLHTAAAVA